jgi:hypothetical protein
MTGVNVPSGAKHRTSSYEISPVPHALVPPAPAAVAPPPPVAPAVVPLPPAAPAAVPPPPLLDELQATTDVASSRRASSADDGFIS